MTVYKTIINPNGQKESIVVPLWNAIAEKIAPDQVYDLYSSINNFITLLPICAAESIINDFMDHVKQEAFLIDLNAASDKDGNINWEYFFRYNNFIRKMYGEIEEKGKDFKWYPFILEYRKSLE